MHYINSTVIRVIVWGIYSWQAGQSVATVNQKLHHLDESMTRRINAPLKIKLARCA